MSRTAFFNRLIRTKGRIITEFLLSEEWINVNYFMRDLVSLYFRENTQTRDHESGKLRRELSVKR